MTIRIRSILTYYKEEFLTCSLIKRFVNVRNCVTNNAILPGIADMGIMKLILEATTIVIQGR